MAREGRMSSETTIKILSIGGMFQIMCQVMHPMEAEERLDRNSGRNIEANYITQLAFKVNGSIIAELLLGKFVSSNPVVGTSVQSLNKGDVVSVNWQDISGRSGAATVTIS
jgi:thiosulfate oxidation carrier complex protein SoxZ